MNIHKNHSCSSLMPVPVVNAGDIAVRDVISRTKCIKALNSRDHDKALRNAWKEEKNEMIKEQFKPVAKQAIAFIRHERHNSKKYIDKKWRKP